MFCFIIHEFLISLYEKPLNCHINFISRFGQFVCVWAKGFVTKFMNSKAHSLPLYHHGILTIIIYIFIFKGHWLSNIFGTLLRPVEWKWIGIRSKTTNKLNMSNILYGMKSFTGRVVHIGEWYWYWWQKWVSWIVLESMKLSDHLTFQFSEPFNITPWMSMTSSHDSHF